MRQLNIWYYWDDEKCDIPFSYFRLKTCWAEIVYSEHNLAIPKLRGMYKASNAFFKYIFTSIYKPLEFFAVWSATRTNQM